ncbi:MAG TPA: chromate transporter, partial [Halanaerobiales bacterium]|nr:chromate transporter [Halanaerobiales bacterium]
MIPLIQQEIIRNGWLSLETFLDIIAISQMTPGPIAINSGTFIGYQAAGFAGALVATIGVVTPSFILVIALSKLIKKMRQLGYLESLLLFLKPVVVGLIVAAAYSIGKTAIIDYISIIISAAVFLILWKYKTRVHPIFLIIAAGVAGMI